MSKKDRNDANRLEILDGDDHGLARLDPDDDHLAGGHGSAAVRPAIQQDVPIQTLQVAVPLMENTGEAYSPIRLEMRLNAEESEFLNRLFLGLQCKGMLVGYFHNGPRHPDAVRWLLMELMKSAKPAKAKK